MKEFLSILKEESGKWVTSKIISEDQKKKIVALYGERLGQFEKAESSHKIVAVISILGAILLGVGVMLFVASNWEEIPKWAKILLLTSSTFGAFLIGYVLGYVRENYRKTGMAVLLLSCIFFGASLFLIAQIYHIGGDVHPLLLLWLLAVIPLLYVFRSTSVAGLSVLILGVWLGFFLVQTVELEEATFNVYFVFGLLLYGLGLLHDRFYKVSSLGAPFKIIGIIVTTAVTYLFTFGGIVEEVNDFLFYDDPHTQTPFTILAFLTGLLFIFLTFFRPTKVSTNELFASTALLLLGFLFEFFPAIDLPSDVQSSSGYQPIFFPVLYNIVLLGIIVALIFMGYRTKVLSLVNLGLFFFAIQVISRYFDFFYKLLPRSLFFIVGGLILLGGGVIIEKQRRKLIQKITSQPS